MSYRKRLKKRDHFATILVTSSNCVPQPSKWQWSSFSNSLAQHIYATRLVERVPFMSQVTAKLLHSTLRKNLETPARNVGPRSNICGGLARAIPNHTSKPLPSWPSQAPRRPCSPPRYFRDGGSSRWCWPCNAPQQRPHNAANACTHAATQRCTSVVKSLPTEKAM